LLVASSIIAINVTAGCSGPNQGWGLPSAWTSIPSWAIRSRRARRTGRRRARAPATPAASNTRRTVLRLSRMPSRSASISVKCC
jgi:hypothetical protein